MKHVFTLVLAALWLLAPTPPAQAQTGDPVRDKLALIFAPLDKSQVPTGRLAEYATPLAPLPAFDGVLRDSGRTDLDGFRHLYAMALSSRITGSDTLPGIPAFNQRVRALAPATAGAAIPVAVQYVRYARLRPDAETAGLLTLQNEQLYDVPGRTQSPYQTAVLFAAAPERAYSATSNVTLVLRRNLYLTGGAPSATPALYLDFGDGQGYRAATWNQPLSTAYATAGTKRVKVKLVYSYNPTQPLPTGRVGTQAVVPLTTETRESWFDLTVFAVQPAARYDDSPAANPGFNQPFFPTVSGPFILPYYTGPFRSDYTDHLGAMVNVRYGQGHSQITKPFIVVEGYNTSRIAPHLVGKNNKNNTLESFLEEADKSTPFAFHDALFQAGYDLIYIDFVEGTDDIRRNAALFQEVVAWVNQQKLAAGSTEPNVVMGESMGGLVARYGLARMVRSGLNPQTRLLLLHDSPQRGANNPLGVQALGRQADFVVIPSPIDPLRTSDLSDKLAEGIRVLDAPATRQLSLLSATDATGGYQANTFIDGPYKDMVDFSTSPGGVPPATFPPIVATSDGSQCGRPQNILPHQELMHNDRLYLLTAFYAAGVGFRSEAWANALPAYGTQERIAYLRVWVTLRVLWLKLDIPIMNRNYQSPANTLPYETLPGGTENLSEQQDVAGDENTHDIPLYRIFSNTTFYNGDICFVPTYSALDVQTVTPATAAASYLFGAPPLPNAVPRVARFIAQGRTAGTVFNLPHLRFTARNSEWIFNELQQNSSLNDTLNCMSECSPYPAVPISGPSVICSGTSATFTVAPPFGSVAGWTATPAGLVTVVSGGSGSTALTLAPASAGSSGIVTLTAQLESGCFAATTLPLRVAVGVGQLAVASNEPNCATTYPTFSLTALGVTNIQWYLNNSPTPDPRYDGATSVQVPYLGGNAVVYVTGNSCGQTVAADGTYAQPRGTARCTDDRAAAGTVEAYPNPAHESLRLERPGSGQAPIVTVRLFDAYGRERLSRPLTGASLQLDTRTLPAGLYFLHLTQDGRTERRQIQITH